MSRVDFISSMHRSTRRDYLGRVNAFPKAEAARVAKRFDHEYWDGDRRYGYGGYHYDGRWRPVAREIAHHYQLKSGDRVLEVGCGKAYLLYELIQEVPGLEVCGIDVSEYALLHAKEEVRPHLQIANAAQLPYDGDRFDLVLSISTLHNLLAFELEAALKEIVRVGRGRGYLVVESYRNEEEKANLLYWQLTCEAFFTPEEWAWWYERCGYTGDYSFIYFE